MEFRGGKNQIGNWNRQFTNSHNKFTININVNCTECRQHQLLEGVSSSQGNLHHVMHCLQKIAASGDQPCDHPTAEPDIQCQIKPTTQSQEQELSQQISSPETMKAVTNSVRILDSRGQVLKPGDAIYADDLSIFVGDEYVVRFDEYSNTVVKEKLYMTRRFRIAMAKSDGKLNGFPPEQRVQRALHHVGKPCPVPGGSGADFVYWTYTGLSLKQSFNRGFKLYVYSFLRWTDSQQQTRQMILDSPERRLHTRLCPEII